MFHCSRLARQENSSLDGSACSGRTNHGRRQPLSTFLEVRIGPQMNHVPPLELPVYGSRDQNRVYTRIRNHIVILYTYCMYTVYKLAR